MSGKPRMIGINHVALEVGSIDEALAFYGELFDLRGVEREPGMAFIDMGDQFLALAEAGPHDPDRQGQAGPHHADRQRHFGLVVDDRGAARAALERMGVRVTGSPRLNFRDPWGNQIQVVEYSDIQFTKVREVLRGMGLDGLGKREAALAELRAKGLA
jgi:catechol 2,3-dioxygenase-like lactoylglutathione lyase family enzyme